MEKEVKEFIENLFLLVHNGDYSNGIEAEGMDEGRGVKNGACRRNDGEAGKTMVKVESQ